MMSKGTPASSQIIFLENRVKELEEELDSWRMDGAHAAARIAKLEEELGQANLDFFSLGATGFDMKKHIAELNHYVKLVQHIANDYHELSYDKAYNQRDWWKKCCKELMEKHPIESEEKMNSKTLLYCSPDDDTLSDKEWEEISQLIKKESQ